MRVACARGHYHQWTLLTRVHTNCRIPDFRDIGSGPGAWDLQLKQEFFSVILSYIRSYPLTRAIAMLCWSSRLGHEAGDTSRDTWGTWGQFKWTFHKHNLTFNTFFLLTLNPWKVLVVGGVAVVWHTKYSLWATWDTCQWFKSRPDTQIRSVINIIIWLYTWLLQFDFRGCLHT